MDPELLKQVQEAVRESVWNEVSTTTWVGMLVALIAAAIGAFFGAYLRRKAENWATKEDFNELLRQLKTQTQATEAIKAKIQKDLDSFGNTLERGREFIGFRRERIGKHMDQVLESYLDIYSISLLVALTAWLNSTKDIEAEAQFRAALCRLRVHFGALVCLGVISKEVSAGFSERDSKVLMCWDKVLGEAAYRIPEFQAKHPDMRAYDAKQFHEEWKNLMDQVEALGRVVKELSSTVMIPL